jgi:hypothetical protein
LNPEMVGMTPVMRTLAVGEDLVKR